MFKPIDMTTWKRKEYFKQYFQNVPCTYSMTINMDITRLKQTATEKGYSFAAVMIYLLALQVNRHEEFRTSVDKDGAVGIYDFMNPSYAVFHKKSETFSCLWTPYNPDFQVFQKNYREDIQKYGELEGFSPKPGMPENTFDISNIPWTSFSGFNLNLPKSASYLLPIFTLGKYFHDGKRILLPVSAQVHHAVCDGFHLCRFLNELQEQANEFGNFHP